MFVEIEEYGVDPKGPWQPHIWINTDQIGAIRELNHNSPMINVPAPKYAIIMQFATPHDTPDGKEKVEKNFTVFTDDITPVLKAKTVHYAINAETLFKA